MAIPAPAQHDCCSIQCWSLRKRILQAANVSTCTVMKYGDGQRTEKDGVIRRSQKWIDKVIGACKGIGEHFKSVKCLSVYFLHMVGIETTTTKSRTWEHSELLCCPSQLCLERGLLFLGARMIYEWAFWESLAFFWEILKDWRVWRRGW